VFGKRRESDPASDGERAAADSFKERVAQYNQTLADEGQAAADLYAHEAKYAGSAEYRKARGK
jgi:hypothetical protein